MLSLKPNKESVDKFLYDADSSRNFTFTLGLQFDYHFSDRIAIETGLLYSQKKKYFADNILSSDSLKLYTFHLNSKYLELPIAIKYYINKPSAFNYYVSGGFIFNSNFPSKDKSYFMLTHNDTSGYYEKLTLEPQSIGFALLIGAGIEYAMAINSHNSLRFI